MNESFRWKHNAPYALCLSHDVDRVCKQWYHYLFYSRRDIKAQLVSLMEKIRGEEPYWNFYKIAELEMQYNARSTFLFLHESHKELSANFIGRYSFFDKDVVEIIKWLDKNGFDVGLHGSYYSYNNLELLKKEKAMLEDILGHEVVSTRQHFLNHDACTFDIQHRIGLRYDSTIGNKTTTGENYSPFPYYESGMLEMPITVMDSVPLFSEEDMQYVIKGCTNVAEKGGVVMLNFHQRQLCNSEYPFIFKTYRYLLDKASGDKAWITNMRDIGEYWERNCKENDSKREQA